MVLIICYEFLVLYICIDLFYEFISYFLIDVVKNMFLYARHAIVNSQKILPRQAMLKQIQKNEPKYTFFIYVRRCALYVSLLSQA